MWVKAPEGLQHRDYRTKALWADGEVACVPDHDFTFVQLVNQGALVECQEDGAPLPPPPQPEAEAAPAPDAGVKARPPKAPADPAAKAEGAE